MNRAYAIDVVRCLAIVGMVLSGQIIFNPELPAWMFHAQTPPPSFAFNPSVPGITWVDLVFPFFLFVMGAAFPLALRKKTENGVNAAMIMAGTVKRWFLLAFFAIALANTRFGTVSQITQSSTAAGAILIGTWALFFCMFVRLPRMGSRANTLLNLCGAAAIAGLMLFYRYALGLDVSVMHSDIIILLLSLMVLFGTAVWYFTRDNIILRLGILAILVALRVASKEESSWVAPVWEWTPAEWLFRFDYLKYLCIVIPGTIAGDIMYRWMKTPKTEERKSVSRPAVWATVFAAVVFIAVMWSLYARHVAVGVAISAVFGAAAIYLFSKDRSTTGKMHYAVFAWGMLWLIIGLALEACEGGIRKDHATYSYFFTTAGLASMAVTVISVMITSGGVNMNFLIKCGQNPMIAYTAAGYVVVPLFAVLQLAPALGALGEAGAWWGVLRGVIVTALMMLFTAAFTRQKIFWRT